MAKTSQSTIPNNPQNLKILARSKTSFNDILVIQEKNLRALWFNGNDGVFLQSRINKDNLSTLELVYSRMSLAALLFNPFPHKILIIGLGAGVFPRALSQIFPGAQIDVVEIDNKVVDFAKKFFYFKESKKCKVFVDDGRWFLNKNEEKYDIIFLDAFKSGSVPFHLKTLQFYQEIKSALTDQGVVGSNLYGKSNSLKSSDDKTLRKVFPQLYYFQDSDQVATVSIATLEKERLSKEKMKQKSKEISIPPDFNFSFDEVINFYRDGLIPTDEGRVFQDEFGKEDLRKKIDENNLNDNLLSRKYPIKPVS